MGLGKTEWEDILIEKGIINAPKEATIEHHPDIVYDLSNKNDENRDEIDDLFSDEDDDEFVQQYRSKQIQNLKLKQMSLFGSITEISRNDFVVEVTEASKKCPVFVYLYQTGIVNCQLLGKWLTQSAAPANPSLKFVQIVSTRCIPNYPDSNLPTVLLYRLGAVQKRILGADVGMVQELIDQVIETENNNRKSEQEKEQINEF